MLITPDWDGSDTMNIIIVSDLFFLNNSGFMTREAAACRKSCGACKVCSPSDMGCLHANRKAGGYLELNKDEYDRLGVPWWMGPEPSPEL